MPRLVGRLPRTVVQVQLGDPHGAGRGAVRYTAGTSDGRRPAVVTIDPAAPETRLVHRLEPWLLHAALPGRHVQVGLAREQAALPAFRRALDVPVFSNGWALYAESLGSEVQAGSRDLAVQFGRLASERLFTLALIVDTGVHALGWSRDEANAFLRRHAPEQAPGLVDRIAASPGELLTYKLGELGIRGERRRVERELGPWFDPREFHEVVLRQGAVPLDVLEEQVTAYVSAARATVPGR
jgi:uncharacterized protein (DUF885 family)